MKINKIDGTSCTFFIHSKIFVCEMIEILFKKKKKTDEAMKDTKWKG